MKEKEKNDDSEFKEEIIIDIPRKVSPPKMFNSKLIGKKTILRKSKTYSIPKIEPKIEKKSNAEFLVESIVKTYWTSKWKDQLLIMKYSKQRFNRKRGDFRNFCMKINKAIKYHQYIYLAKLFDKMDNLPKKEKIKHNVYYGKLKFVKNDNTKYGDNINELKDKNLNIIKEIKEVEYKPEKEIKDKNKNDDMEMKDEIDKEKNNEKFGKLKKTKTIIKRKKDNTNLINEENNLQIPEKNDKPKTTISLLDNILTGKANIEENNYINMTNKQENKPEKKENKINYQIEIKKVEEQKFQKDKDNNDLNKKNKKVKKKNFLRLDEHDDIKEKKRKSFDFSEINNINNEVGILIDEDIDNKKNRKSSFITEREGKINNFYRQYERNRISRSKFLQYKLKKLKNEE